MISATRMLCQKYTDLTDAEISYLESYGALLPALANAEQADVSSTAGPSAGALPSWSVRRSPKPSPPTTAAPSWVC